MTAAGAFFTRLGSPELVAARLVSARTGRPQLDLGILGALLDRSALPALTAVAGHAPGAVEGVGLAFLQAALDLERAGLAGEEGRWIVESWVRILARSPGLLATGPELIGALTNAAWQVRAEATARREAWLNRLERVAPACGSPAELRAASLHLCWRAGLAAWRRAGREAFLTLPVEVARLLVDEPGLTREQQAGLFDHPWVPPSIRSLPRQLRLVGRIGGLRAFGGEFVSPPLVGVVDDGGSPRLLAWDAEGAVQIFVDCYGQSLRRVDWPRPAGPTPLARGLSLDAAGRLGWAAEGLVAETLHLPLLAGYGSAASDGFTLLVSLPHSHHLFVVARVPVPAEGQPA